MSRYLSLVPALCAWVVVVELLLGASACGAALAEGRLEKIGESVVDAEALTIQGPFGQAINGKSFQQDAIATHSEYQYVAYYDQARHVCLARRRLPGGDWEVVRFEDYDFKSNDAHNTISMGICPRDGTIHLAFDHHGGPLHYRVSRKGVATAPESVPWDASLFGPVRSDLEEGKAIRLTYPRFWQTPSGDLQFGYRMGGSGNGDRMLVDYDGGSGVWQNTRQIDSGAGVYEDEAGSSASRNSYPNGYTYGPDGKLHVTWVWREDARAANHDLMYAYSDDLGVRWRNNVGELLEGPPHVASPGVTVVRIPPGYGLMNTGGQTVDSAGRVHAVVWHTSDQSLAAAGAKRGDSRWGPPAARRNHHYWRREDGAWEHRELPGVAGSRPKIFVDRQDNAYVVFGRRTGEWDGANTHPENGLTLMAASAASQWTDWQEIYRDERAVVSEMLYDSYRWSQEGVLSVLVQDSPTSPHEPTALRVIDFRCAGASEQGEEARD